MDVLIPPDIPIAEIEWRILDNTAVSTSPLNGVTTTFTRPGTRWGARLSFRNLKDRDRARLLAIIAAVRGRSGRVYFTSAADPARTGGYSFPELFTNADFASGVTGWSQSAAALSVSDRVMRITATSIAAPCIYQNPAVTQYAPLIVRGFAGARSRNGTFIGTSADGISNYATDAQGMVAQSWVPLSAFAGNTFPIVHNASGNAGLVGDWLDTPFVSLSRCALVDNGPNALLYSDQIDNAAWTKANVTITANGATAPDGTTTADAIVENSATSQHYVQQSVARASAAEDICAYGYFKRGAGARNIRLIAGDSSLSNYGQAYFDLGAGTVSAGSINGSATNPRAFIRAAGDGWYFCSVVVRLPTSTGLTNYAELTDGTTTGYTGDGTSSVYAWRLGAARSGLPTRGALTTGTALASGTGQNGSGLYLKGLPASTQNIRAAGDMVEIVLPTYSQLVRLTAALDSDAAGLGYLQFENPVRTSPADNAAVIFNQPMMRGILSEGPMWPTRPGLFSDFDLDLIEDIAP
jgi:hypothetical protein